MLLPYDPNVIADIIVEAINQVIKLATEESVKFLSPKMVSILIAAVKHCLATNRFSLINVRDYLMTLDSLTVQENSTDPASIEQAAQLRIYLLPGMESQATPLGTDPAYLTQEGWLNVQKHFNELEAQSSDLSSLNPLASFSKADSYYAEQRWLVVGTILIAISLFWLGLSQLSHLRSRVLILVLGVLVYGIGLVWSVGVEIVFFIVRTGGL